MEYRYMTDNTESEILLAEGLSDDVVYLNGMSFEGDTVKKYCLYDIDSLMQYVFKNYGEVCYHTISLLSNATPLHKVISVITSIEEADRSFYCSAIYTFENGFEYSAEMTDIDTIKEAEDITRIFEQTASFIFYMKGHIPAEYISLDYEHWG